MLTASRVLLTGVALAWLLAGTAPRSPEDVGAIITMATPATVRVGEPVSIRGVALVIAGEDLDKRFHVCDDPDGWCHARGWGSIDGRDPWLGFAGNGRLDAAGAFRYEWTLYGDWGVDARRALVRHAVEVHGVASHP